MDRLHRSGKTVGFLLGVTLFVLAPLTVSAFWAGFPFGNGGVPAPVVNMNKFPGKLCPSTISTGWLSVPVFLPCKKDTPPPPPADKCPHVPGKQTSLPCADDVCEDSGGTWDGDSCNFPPPAQPALTFGANPTTIQTGSSTALTWDSTNATSCTASNGWSGSKSVDGSQSVSPTATTTYQLECSGAGGTTTESVVVNVILVAPEPEDPTLTFTAAQGTINEGATTTLNWDSSYATSCSASNGWSGSKSVDGSEVVGPTATTTYTLTCTGDGGSIAVSATVNVILDEEPAPEGKLLITEVMYDLTTSTTTPQGSETANEWIEIFNGTNSAINLSNYSIADASSTDALPSVVVPAGKYAVITASSTTASFYSIPSDAVIAQIANATLGNGLGNAGDMVSLVLNVGTTTVDAVSWGTNTTAFSPSVSTVDTNAGHSIARIDDTVDTNTAADWQEQNVPNPGQ